MEPDGAPLLALARRGAGRVVGAALPPGSAELAPLWAELVLGLLPQEGKRSGCGWTSRRSLRGSVGSLPGVPWRRGCSGVGSGTCWGSSCRTRSLPRGPWPRVLATPGARGRCASSDPALRSPSPSLLLELWDGDALATRLPAPLPLPPDLVRPPWPALTSVPARSVPVQDPDGSAPGLLTGAGLGLLALAGLARPGGRRRAPLSSPATRPVDESSGAARVPSWPGHPGHPHERYAHLAAPHCPAPSLRPLVLRAAPPQASQPSFAPGAEPTWIQPSASLQRQLEAQAARLTYAHGLEEKYELIRWFVGTGEVAYPTLFQLVEAGPTDEARALALSCLASTADPRLLGAIAQPSSPARTARPCGSSAPVATWCWGTGPGPGS